MVSFIDDHRDECGAEPIGHVPPTELEEAYNRQSEESTMAAKPKQTSLGKNRDSSHRAMKTLLLRM